MSIGALVKREVTLKKIRIKLLGKDKFWMTSMVFFILYGLFWYMAEDIYLDVRRWVFVACCSFSNSFSKIFYAPYLSWISSHGFIHTFHFILNNYLIAREKITTSTRTSSFDILSTLEPADYKLYFHKDSLLANKPTFQVHHYCYWPDTDSLNQYNYFYYR